MFAVGAHTLQLSLGPLGASLKLGAGVLRRRELCFEHRPQPGFLAELDHLPPGFLAELGQLPVHPVAFRPGSRWA